MCIHEPRTKVEGQACAKSELARLDGLHLGPLNGSMKIAARSQFIHRESNSHLYNNKFCSEKASVV